MKNFLLTLLCFIFLFSSSVFAEINTEDVNVRVQNILEIQKPVDRIKELRSALKSFSNPKERIQFMRSFLAIKKERKSVKNLENKKIIKEKDEEREVEKLKSLSTETVKVDSVYDGDTVHVMLNGEDEKIRILGIEAPEMREGKKSSYKGEDSKKYMQNLVEGKEVQLVRDSTTKNRGSFGRLLRYIYINDVDMGQKMIEEGYAKVYRYSVFAKKQEYLNIEKQVQELEKGIWDGKEEQVNNEKTSVNSSSKNTEIKNIILNCNYAPYCSYLNSCEEAYFFLNTCNLSRLDRDKDGVPCESLCGK